MKMLLLLPAFLLAFQNVYSQIKTDSLPGEYHLQGVMETASAILLKPDSTFEIFFSYGAMDRQGAGKWTFRDGKIKLDSPKKPEKDFALVTSKVSDDQFTTIKIVQLNEQFLPHFEALVKSSGGEKYGKMNQQGIYQIPKVKATSIELFFNFTPERFSTFPVTTDDNYFEFRIEPWIADIFAVNITLTPSEDGLTGEHPLLQGDHFSFQKMK